MSNVLQSHADYPTVKVPDGEIALRDDRTGSKWKVTTDIGFSFCCKVCYSC